MKAVLGLRCALCITRVVALVAVAVLSATVSGKVHNITNRAVLTGSAAPRNTTSAASSVSCDSFHRAGNVSLYHINYNFIQLSRECSPLHAANKNDSTVSITLATQLSPERRYMVELLAKVWSGPIIFVYYSGVGDARKLQVLVNSTAILSQRCNIYYHHVVRNASNIFYPINILRNVGMRAATTSHVFPLDVDFLPRPGMYDDVQKFLTRRHQQLLARKGAYAAKQSKSVYIVPAFETAKTVTKRHLLRKFPKNKPALVSLWRRTQQIVVPFRQEQARQIHGPTNFTRWQTAHTMYEVKYQWNFAPSFVIAKEAASHRKTFAQELAFDENFVGYGWDRATLPARLAFFNFTFFVLPNEFIIHVPHKPSDAKKLRITLKYEKCYSAVARQFISMFKTKATHSYIGMS